MKKTIISLSLFLSSIVITHAQEALKNGVGLGFSINSNQGDFGLGLNVTSPYFVNQLLAVRLSTTYQWLQNYDIANNQTRWSGYPMFRLGIVSKSNLIANFLKLYGEAGLVGIVPNIDISSHSIETGGYGLFGFEFFANSSFCYFLELGGMGTGSIADKVPTKPIYANGFMVNVGLRILVGGK